MWWRFRRIERRKGRAWRASTETAEPTSVRPLRCHFTKEMPWRRHERFRQSNRALSEDCSAGPLPVCVSLPVITLVELTHDLSHLLPSGSNLRRSLTCGAPKTQLRSRGSHNSWTAQSAPLSGTTCLNVSHKLTQTRGRPYQSTTLSVCLLSVHLPGSGLVLRHMNMIRKKKRAAVQVQNAPEK